jgi:hypothetical protein
VVAGEIMATASGVQLIAQLAQSDDLELKWRALSLLASLPASVVPVESRRAWAKDIGAAVDAISKPVTVEPQPDEDQIAVVTSAASFLGSLANVEAPPVLASALRPLCGLLKVPVRDV